MIDAPRHMVMDPIVVPGAESPAATPVLPDPPDSPTGPAPVDPVVSSGGSAGSNGGIGGSPGNTADRLTVTTLPVTGQQPDRDPASRPIIPLALLIGAAACIGLGYRRWRRPQG